MALGKKKTQRARVKKEITLSEIKELGGEEDDLALVAGVDENSDSEIENESKQVDFNEDPIKKDEIKEFLSKLEIYKYRPKPEDSEEKPKENKPEGLQKEDANSEESSSTAATEKSPKKKKKAKNKFKTESEEDGSSPVANQKKKSKKKGQLQDDEVSSTTVEPGSSGYKNPIPALRSHMANYQPRKYLLVKTGGDWIDMEDKKCGEGQTVPEGMVKQMEEFAAKLLRDEISVYNKQKENSKRSDVGWMRTVLASGTLADKMGALMVMVQESPLHNLTQLETLISMTKKKGKRECLQACDTLKELFMSELLPENRKLRTFAERPFLELGQSVGWNKDSIDKRLLMWYFEAKLKEKYMEFLKSLQTMSHDTVLATKQKAINTMYHMLVNKPEQEKFVLTMLINKVGDPHYKLASTVSYLLMKVVETHPNMKGVLVREVEEVLFRPNISPRAQYYSVCFLTQLILSHEEQELAFKLISIYFSFFKGYVKKGEVDSKMMSALLSGVNRAFPYAKLHEEFLHEHLEPLYKIVHVVNFNTSIQALTLLYQVMDMGQSTSERYYTALYRKLMDPAMKTSSKQTLYLNLLFKSLKKDESERRVKAFIKRLLQVCAFQTPQFICGALVLLSEVLRNRPGLMSLSHVQEDSDDEEHFTDDPGDDDVAAVDDKQEEPAKEVDNTKGEVKEENGKKTGPSSWIHRQNFAHKANATQYDPQVRNPLYCHAETECIWELEALAQHYHPSVSLFAAQILRGEHITYGGDPLQDFTLIRFLDRFVYKNPKKKEIISQKVQTLSRKKYSPRGVKGMAVTTDQFLNLKENRIPVDDIYLHRFFSQKAARDKLKKKGDDDADSDAESVGDDEFDAFLDKYEGNVDAPEIGDLNIDFASEFGKTKGKGDIDDSDSDEELSDEEIQFDDEDFAELRAAMGSDDEEGQEGMDHEDFDEAAADDEIDFDEENFEFSDGGEDDDFQELAPKKKTNKRKNESSKEMKSPKKAKTNSNLFAASEEFGSLIDENVGSKLDSTGSEAVVVKDKADAKQIQWELKRDKWVRGQDWKSKRRGDKGKHKKFNKRKGPGKGGRKR